MKMTQESWVYVEQMDVASPGSSMRSTEYYIASFTFRSQYRDRRFSISIYLLPCAYDLVLILSPPLTYQNFDSRLTVSERPSILLLLTCHSRQRILWGSQEVSSCNIHSVCVQRYRSPHNLHCPKTTVIPNNEIWSCSHYRYNTCRETLGRGSVLDSDILYIYSNVSPIVFNRAFSQVSGCGIVSPSDT